VGSTIEVGGAVRTIVGVAPDEFEFPNTPDLWLPIGEGFLEGRDSLADGSRLLGILAPGRSLDEGRTQLAAIATSIRPGPGADGPVRLEATRFTDLGPMAVVLATAVVGIVAAVLLMIAANVANLILARSFMRSRELALRAALGASRPRLVAQLVVEVLLIGGLAAALGSAAARAVLGRFNTMDEIPFWADFTGGPLTTALVVFATLVATAIAGAWPALRATRRDVAAALQGGDGRSSEARFGRAAGAMVIVQIAVSVVMLHGALVVAQEFAEYSSPALSLPSNVLTAPLGLDDARTQPEGAGPGARLTVDEIERIATSLPGVVAAGVGTALPRHSPAAQAVEVEALPGEPSRAPQLAPSAAVSAGFFGALGAAPIAGRLLSPADYLAGAPKVAVVNEPFVRKFLDGASPLGRRLRVAGAGPPGAWREIVGVVPDLGLSVGDPSLAAGYYVPLGEEPGRLYLAMRVAGDPLSFAGPLRRAFLDRDPGFVLNLWSGSRTWRARTAGSSAGSRWRWSASAWRRWGWR